MGRLKRNKTEAIWSVSNEQNQTLKAPFGSGNSARWNKDPIWGKSKRGFSLSNQHLTKEILPISLRVRDGIFQPEELPNNNLMWTHDARPTLYGQWLAWQITVDHSIDPADRVEPVEILKPGTNFQGKIIIDCKKQPLKEATKDRAGLVIWTDESKLNNGSCGAAICYQRRYQWKQKKYVSRKK